MNTSKFLHLSLWMVVVACSPRPHDSSTGKSLDTYVAAKATDNPNSVSERCRGPFSSTGRVIAPTLPIQKVLEQTLTSIPDGAKRLFFRVGTIEATTDLAQCLAKMDKATAAFVSLGSPGKVCLEQRADGFKILLYPDERVIRMQVLRAVATYLTGSFAEQFIAPEDDRERGISTDEAYVAAKRFAAFVTSFKQSIKSAPIDEPFQSIRARLVSDQDLTLFAHEVLVETIDSAYCNDQTNTSFRQRFPKIATLFGGETVSSFALGDADARFGSRTEKVGKYASETFDKIDRGSDNFFVKFPANFLYGLGFAAAGTGAMVLDVFDYVGGTAPGGQIVPAYQEGGSSGSGKTWGEEEGPVEGSFEGPSVPPSTGAPSNPLGEEL